MRPLRTALAATLALLVLASCSSSADDDAGTPTGGPTSASTTAPDTTTSLTVTPDDTSVPAGGVVSGDGYSLAIPDGWEDVTALAKKTNDQADVAVAEPEHSGQFRTNFNVVAPNPIADTVTDAQLAAQAATELASVTNNKVTPVPPTFEFDGVEPLGQQSEVSSGGFDVTVMQFILVHDGRIYPTTLTFESKRADEAAGLIADIADSWTWQIS